MKLIVALDLERGIGFNNTLPWPRIRSDMKWFRDNTEYCSVIMGRNTWLSLPGKLATRQNIVVTSSPLSGPDSVVSSIAKAIEVSELPIFFIGGERIFREAINIVDEMLITEILDSFETDVVFPEFDEGYWRKSIIAVNPMCNFTKYERIQTSLY